MWIGGERCGVGVIVEGELVRIPEWKGRGSRPHVEQASVQR